ncbi:MAG: His/Gly/Thr/Pro-type tRNA ligase C-terminal domain-containing protein [Candidatus Pacebacteria bacterium]|nr:His/Gly/Thr/Pro-type tRNA ligase C-terminal domain-containing protein [Candidatus Paceibacterota bacterium]
MLQSQLFTKTRKEAPKDEVAKNAELLIRAGYIHKEMAGVYSYLPLGLRVLNKIALIIRREMNAIGGQEIFMTTLQNKELWEKTGRWSDEKIDNWFKTKLKNGTEVGIALTHEEMLTAIMAEEIKSYKDLPRSAYQIQTKFRNEARAKSGIMRCREFMMKDLYSFSRDEKEHEAFYEGSKEAYKKVFEGVGIGKVTYLTMASGGIFSKYSHEFQTLTSAGEDLIYICDKCKEAVNKEVIADFKNACPKCGNTKLREEKAVEVGNIFPLGTRFSDALGLQFLDEKGEKKSVVMGSYGIGLGRLMGVIVEVFADEKGIVWPKEVSPFQAHLVSLAGEDTKVKKSADELYKKLTEKGIEVLYDDRGLRPGEKFADSDLIGIPLRIVVSAKTLEADGYEIKDRATGATELVKEDVLLKIFK